MSSTTWGIGAHFPPQADQGKSITQAGFKITTHKLPILKAGPIEDMTSRLGIAPPEMGIGAIYRGIIPFVAIQIFGLLLCILMPGIVLWLPGLN